MLAFIGTRANVASLFYFRAAGILLECNAGLTI
jgi:hypothetical protein